ncbi:CBM35 domain-containing protein [Micromonospora sp. NPDC005197]|uniref:CBM35 domain-containing protein n=1 Tax=Micromonospora sp. NPDC005197 TaxID=3157020 RepID=UPI0033A6EC99
MLYRNSPRRRATAVVAVGILSTGLALAPSGPAQASHHQAQDSAVRSGNARFEVLSPTLIRTEYQKDGRFTDAATFNAIGRDDFPRTRFTKQVEHGWLTIDTGAMTLRYQVGSGAFTADNLTVRLKTGKQLVQGQPWAGHTAPACAFGALCEAESLQLSGPGVATDHRGYTGRGFAAGFASSGDSVTFALDAPAGGTKQLSVRYANSTGGDGQNVARTLTVLIDGDSGRTLTLPPTANWDTWGLASVPVDLTAGRHEITVVRGPNDSGNVNIDSLAVLNPGDPFPAPAAPEPQSLRFGTLGEAETGALTGGAKPANDHNGASGTGFLAGLESTTAAVALTVTDVPSPGDYQVQIRYANGQAGAQPSQARTMSVTAGTAAPVTATSRRPAGGTTGTPSPSRSTSTVAPTR